MRTFVCSRHAGELKRFLSLLNEICDREYVQEEVGSLVPAAELLITEANARSTGYWPFPSFQPAELRVEPAKRRKARAQAKAKTNLRKMKVLGRMAGNVNTHLDAEKRAHEARVSAKQKLVFDRQERARCAQHVNMSSPHGVTTTHSSCLSVSLV